MLTIIISTNPESRIKKRETLLPKAKEGAVFLDDTTADIRSLEQYAFPSLFSRTLPSVHAKYLIEESRDQVTPELLTTLISSPTFFLLEERTLAAALLKTLEKAGAIIHHDKEVKPKATSTIFAVTGALTAGNKKDRWLSYRNALREHAVEALLGILYWKLRALIESAPKKEEYKTLYRAFMIAQKEAWQKGFPLELALEKVILEN